jgi:restriction endonuclease Mrr
MTSSTPHPTDADLPVPPALQAELQARLGKLSYLSLALLTRRLLASMGYTSVRLLGRRHWRGRTEYGGADLSAQWAEPGGAAALVQVKRYARPVSRRFVDELRGAILRQGFPQGVLVTTGEIALKARDAADSYPGRPIRLIDGAEFARLLIQAGIGVRTIPDLATGAETLGVDEDAFQLLERFSASVRATANDRRRGRA